VSNGSSRAAIVLSGGGVRGAYEVGAVAGMIEVLGLGPGDRAPFQIFTGTSVGAINAAYLASNAHRGDLAIDGLIALWRSLSVDEYVRFDLIDGWRRRRAGIEGGWSILDPVPLARLVARGINWEHLRAAHRRKEPHALLVAALEVMTGQTTMFAQVAGGIEFRPSMAPGRRAVETDIGLDHVLASAALPFIFPARRIGEAFYCDGGLRFNTPIAPAIRCGADRLVIVPMLRESRPLPPRALRRYPNLTFLTGKILNALIADPVERDLHVLERFNRLVEVLDEALSAEERERVARVLRAHRGRDYRKLETLTLRPSDDIGVLAGARIRAGVGGAMGLLLRAILRRTGTAEADWASYVLFDGTFAGDLIELGRDDALRRAGEIRAFFG
jgi:NTE family protein